MNVYCSVSQIPTQKKKKKYRYLIIALYTPNTIYASRNYSRIMSQMSMLAKCRLRPSSTCTSSKGGFASPHTHTHTAVSEFGLRQPQEYNSKYVKNKTQNISLKKINFYIKINNKLCQWYLMTGLDSCVAQYSHTALLTQGVDSVV